ncbi:molybdopterin-containing oxidoreductase family protein [Raoultibacter phocaeensis]|uniref:molybdopterin-containing oxidoreductase family protein n=1 Tax=Raoultibacter phocaeensis TaxID=2479841 RepID=UPI001118870D|nr:molybdopterin-dependent oxidoreductase [Raoultibacter phocaeensis]
MQNENTHGFTRRSFIKGAAVLGAAGALVGCSPQAENMEEVKEPDAVPAEQIYAGVCRANCFGGCLLNIHVRDGRIVRTSAGDFPNTEYNRICTKGLTQPARVYSADRIQYPMRRTGERGVGKFERISWDEAIDEIANKWNGYIQEYGTHSIATFMASGNFGTLAGGGMAGIIPRFNAVMGFSSISNDVDAAQGFAATKIFGGMTEAQANNEPTDYVNTKTFINWASNPAISQPQIFHFIMKAKENGMRFIVVDPVYNATASKADWYIPINPATDGVLAMAILNEIVTNGTENEDFVRTHTEAPLLIKEDGMFLRMSDLGVEPMEGDVDPLTGKPTVIDPYAVWDESTDAVASLEEAKSPAYKGISSVEGISVQTVWENAAQQVAAWPAETASPVCGVSVEDIQELARIYVEDGPVNTYVQLGADHYVNGHYNYWPMYAISAATGNIGKPGAACGPICVLPTMVLNFMVSALPTDTAGNPAQGGGPSYNMNTLLTILENEKYGDQDAVLKSIYVATANPATVWADHAYAVECFKKIDFLVVADITMTETAMYADIMLPVAHWFEVTDLHTNCHTHPYFVWQEKAIEPQFESKSDFDILKTIAEKMGYGSFFEFDGEEYIAMGLENGNAKALGLSVQRLKEEHAVRFMSGETYISFEGGNFLTPTGRASFYKESVAPAYDVGQEIDFSKETSLYWEPTLEADKNSAVRAQYPFHCISEHMRTRTHSQWYDVEHLKDYDPEPIVRINPEDAADLGITEGDTVRLYNDRGSVVMKATLSAGYPRGIVGSPRSYREREFIEGHFASLSTKQYNQVCANQPFNDVAVAIEKA